MKRYAITAVVFLASLCCSAQVTNRAMNFEQNGRVSLGITGQTYSDAYYKGFLIYSIEKGSSLQNTEAQRGDLITAVNSAEITSYAELRAELAKHKPGDTVTLTLLRATGHRVEEFYA